MVARLGKVARTYSQLNLLASEWVRSGRAKSALDVARKACEMEPNCWECFETYAGALDAVGAHAQAARYQAIALTRMPEHGVPYPRVKAAVEALVKYGRAAASSSRSATNPPSDAPAPRTVEGKGRAGKLRPPPK